MAIFQIKHFIADFPLQLPYMLKKFRPGWDFLLPLTTHCAVHALFTLSTVIFFNPKLWWLAIFDFVAHFIMDRLKAGPRYLGRWNDASKASYWSAFGFDQLFHHMTHLYIVWVMVMTPVA